MPRPIRAVPKRRPAVAGHGILYPLDVFYERGGIVPPRAHAISPDAIPLPCRELLVHSTGMTSTLERHLGGRVALRVLSTFVRRRWYFRRVLLVEESSGRPVEMGAIRVKLDLFPPHVRALILRNEVPLGRILRDGGVEFQSHAKVFMAVTPNSDMMGVFWMPSPQTLYGRQTEMSCNGTPVCDIVEVLPPLKIR
jgi:chorismate-pyruvate lyase